MSLLRVINAMEGSPGITYTPSNIADIFILSGQSNAVGQFAAGHVMDLFPSAYAGSQSNIKVFWEGPFDEDRDPGSFENMLVPDNTRDKIYTDPGNTYYNQTGWGVEQSWLHNIKSYLQRTVYLIKNAVGSQSIGAWTYITGPLWQQLTRQILDAKAELETAGKTVRFRGMIWMQGESDKDAGDDVYVGFLNTLIGHIRNDITEGLEDMPFYMVKLLPGTSLYDPEINEAFDDMAAADPTRNFVIETEDIPGVDTIDNLHYDPPTLLSIGETVFNAMVSNNQL